MLDASNAIENQKVSICRLSSENRTIIIKALNIALQASDREKHLAPLTQVLLDLLKQTRKSKEIWLIE